MTILALPRTASTPPDVGALAYALEQVPLTWWSPMLPGEDLTEARARRDAAADMFAEALLEYRAVRADVITGCSCPGCQTCGGGGRVSGGRTCPACNGSGKCSGGGGH